MKLTRNTIRDEHLYSRSNRQIEKQMECWAEEAWLCHCGPDGALLGDCHFECGFKDGFVHYLRTGNTNEPLTPPAEYLKAKYVSWEGRDAINRWIRGYELGSVAGAQSGYRELVQIPVLGAIADEDNPLPPAESVVVDVIGGMDPMYMPMEPQPAPPSLPPAEMLEPTIPVDPVPPQPQPTDAALQEFPLDSDGDFMLPVSQHPLSASGVNHQLMTTDHEHRHAQEPAAEDESNPFALDELTTTDLDSEDTRPSIEMAPLPRSAAADVSFEWLDNLSVEEMPAGNTREESSAGWGRTQATIPSTLEQDADFAPATPAEDEMWLHPPEAAPPSREDNGFGFPDYSEVKTVVFDEDVSQPSQQIHEAAATQQTDETSRRRSALYEHIANARKPVGDHVDQCAQPNEHDINDNTAWPQLDKVILWSDSDK